MLDPPVATRRWNARPFPGVTAANAFRDARGQRLSHHDAGLGPGVVFWSDATRATISPFPLSV